MTPRMFAGGVAALCASIVVSAGLVAQDRTGEPPMSPEQQAWIEAFARFRTPGEEQASLARREGRWNVAGRIWHAPDESAEAFDVTSKIKAILGGRYIVEKVDGEFLGENFEGVGIYGYDNLSQQYVGVWIDNFGTGIQRMEGTASGDGKTIHWTSEQPDVMTGSYEEMHAIGKELSNDEFVHTSYGPSPDGGEVKQMELHYTRVTE